MQEFTIYKYMGDDIDPSYKTIQHDNTMVFQTDPRGESELYIYPAHNIAFFEHTELITDTEFLNTHDLGMFVPQRHSVHAFLHAAEELISVSAISPTHEGIVEMDSMNEVPRSWPIDEAHFVLDGIECKLNGRLISIEDDAPAAHIFEVLGDIIVF